MTESRPGPESLVLGNARLQSCHATVVRALIAASCALIVTYSFTSQDAALQPRATTWERACARTSLVVWEAS